MAVEGGKSASDWHLALDPESQLLMALEIHGSELALADQLCFPLVVLANAPPSLRSRLLMDGVDSLIQGSETDQLGGETTGLQKNRAISV
jgi:hypothetical protein